MKRYLLTEIPHNSINAGYKAKNDIRTVLLSEDFEPIDVRESFKFEKIPEYFKLLKKLRSLENGSEIVLQSPIYSFFNGKFLPMLIKLFRKKEFRIILVIHDLESARFSRDQKSVALEKQLLEACARIIVHNPSMKRYVSEKQGIPQQKLIDLGIFDYLCPAKDGLREFSHSVCLAGNLDPNKSGYLYRLNEMGGIDLHVYGGNFDHSSAGSMTYHGSFQPHELPLKLVGSFGLVWDGSSCQSCVGVTGEYLKINNPHKTSLYLAAGLPVIIWSQAALAPFIEQNGLGFALSSLSELKERLSAITPQDYAEMQLRAKAAGENIRNGFYIKNAIKRAEEGL